MVSGYNIIDQLFKKKGAVGVTGCRTSRMVIARMVINSKGVTAMQKYTVIIVWYYLRMVWDCV